MTEPPSGRGDEPAQPGLELPDLASRALGGSVLAASDEFFADKENLIRPEPPVFQPHTFTAKGQRYDGWETRRRRGGLADHDWVIVRLGAPGLLRQVVVDTAFFAGNFPAQGALDAAAVDGYPRSLEDVAWTEIVPRRPLRGNSANVFPVAHEHRVTHVRLRIYPDGGVARLRVHGHALVDPLSLADVPVDLVATRNGGSVVSASDGFFSPPSNMLQPGESRFMGDGWETARRRGPGCDWAVLRLTARATVRVAEIATTHYQGNAPDRAALYGLDVTEASLDDAAAWTPLLRPVALLPDTTHRFRLSGREQPVTHVRLEIHPDGGVGRFRLYGAITEDGERDLLRRWHQ
jgi:allantoicase